MREVWAFHFIHHNQHHSPQLATKWLSFPWMWNESFFKGNILYDIMLLYNWKWWKFRPHWFLINLIKGGIVNIWWEVERGKTTGILSASWSNYKRWKSLKSNNLLGKWNEMIFIQIKYPFFTFHLISISSLHCLYIWPIPSRQCRSILITEYFISPRADGCWWKLIRWQLGDDTGNHTLCRISLSTFAYFFKNRRSISWTWMRVPS